MYKRKNVFLILNFILFIFFIYVAYIIEGADKYDNRIIIYIFLLFFVLGTLLKINLSGERLEQIFIYLKFKSKNQSQTDDIKEYVE